MQYPNVAAHLLAMEQADDALRSELIAKRQLSDGYHPAMEQLHHEHAHQLERILRDIGYPSISKVGKRGNSAAWLIVQHAIGCPWLMRSFLTMLETAVAVGEADPVQAAYLSDRIATLEDRPQLYGTQFDWNERGELCPQPYDDLKAVAARRKALGMNTLSEQTRLIRERTQREESSPTETYELRRARYDAWRIRVGWISE